VRTLSELLGKLMIEQDCVSKNQQLIQRRQLSILIFRNEFIVSHAQKLLSKVTFHFT